MVNVEVGSNESGQRLDRFLRKYLAKASLSQIYKIIRKDLKVNNKRGKAEMLLKEGDVLSLYISEDEIKRLSEKTEKSTAKKQFTVVYEDEQVLIVYKPSGLLTHGDGKEKKNHLANQVISYLIDEGSFVPRMEKTFTPASCNRLDRNTAGLVIFGKTAASLRLLNDAMKDKEKIKKFYLTIVEGSLVETLNLDGFIVKDTSKNKVTISRKRLENSKEIATIATPIKTVKINGRDYTLVDVQLLTGRSHQIRAHLSSAGYPILGDCKYGGKRYKGISADSEGQLLCAYKLEFGSLNDRLTGLSGKIIEIEPKGKFSVIKKELFG